MRTNRKLVLFGFFISSCFILLAPDAGLAQSKAARSPYLVVRVVDVKPGMRTEWVDGIKNVLIPALKKGGLKSAAIYQTVFGNEYEYWAVNRTQRFSKSGGQSARVRALGTKGAAEQEASLGKYVQSVRVIIIRPQPELSNTPANENPPVCVFGRRRVLTGKIGDYENFVRNEILPIYKKAGEYFETYRRVYGDNNNDFVTVSCVNKFSDLARGPVEARVLGQKQAEKLFTEWNAIAPMMKLTVRHRVPELSY